MSQDFRHPGVTIQVTLAEMKSSLATVHRALVLARPLILSHHYHWR